MARRFRLAVLPLALSVPIACVGARSQASVDQETEAFYAAFEAEVRSSVRSLEEDEIQQLRDIMPLAEVEGATYDVLDVIETRPALRPMVRGIRRFLRDEPSNWVSNELNTERGDRRLWHILLDSIQAELRGAPG
ncbi:MAG: hypothetical protein ACRELU_02560 [Gemmatimonadota bacterium]